MSYDTIEVNTFKIKHLCFATYRLATVHDIVPFISFKDCAN